MKHLLTLISLVSILSIDAKTVSYEIKEGDTLYSIAKDNGISINKIYKANEVLGFSPDNIYAGKSINLPFQESSQLQNECFTKTTLSQFNPDKSKKDVAIHCLSILEKDISLNEIDYLNLNEKELLYLINKDILEFLSKDEPSINNTYFNNDFAASLRKNAINGDHKSSYIAYRSIDLSDKRFINYLTDKTLKTIIDKEQDMEKRLSACSNLDKNTNLNDYDLALYFYLKCTDLFFDDGNNDYIKFDNKVIDLIFSNNSNMVKVFELYAISNIMYHRINTNNEIGALNISRDYLILRCPECNGSSDLFNRAKDEIWSNRNFFDALYYFILNESSAWLYSYSTPKNILEIRDEMIDRFSDSNLSADIDLSTSYLSDTALQLMKWQVCDLASPYLDKAIINYKLESYDNSNEDYFIEPLYLAACYLTSMKINKESRKDLLKVIERATQYRDISREALYELDISNPISLALLKTVSVMIELSSNSSKITEQTFTNYSEQTYSNFKDLSDILRDVEIYNFSGDIENFELMVGLYASIYASFESLGYTDRSTYYDFNEIIDPISLNQMKNNFAINSELLSLRVDKKNTKLLNLQNKLQDNNFKIKHLEQDKKSYQDMLSLYKNNTSIIEGILRLNENLKSLKSPPIKTIKIIQNSLKDNEYAYFLLPSDLFTITILLSKTDLITFQTSGFHKIKSMMQTLIESMDPAKKFDFDYAEMLAWELFPFIDEEESFIPKGSTIYMYTDDLIGVPPSIFVKSYNNSSSISEYERLVTAEWFIKDYNFTTRLSYENKIDIKNTKPFLGIGNSTSYNWVGLPNLNEVNEEITSLALTSLASKDDILINNEATKEYFLSKLDNSYERIVISTHSVPQNWQGLIEEPALVFNSKRGDYFLTPSEIINKDINSDMVVLSSCNASIEGFDELYKSFLIAGSKSVVHSNWNLESRYAKEFTTTFFRELWLNDADKHDAIRNVSLKFLNDYSNQTYAHPAYWGNFSIVYSSAN